MSIPPKVCSNFEGYLIGTKGNECIVTRTRCKQWECEYCCEQNKRQWRAIIIDSVNKIGGEWFMMTLTAHENARTRTNSLINLQNGWKRLTERIRRQSDDKVHYVRIYELHKNGRVHMHFIINWRPRDYRHPIRKTDPGSRWLKDNARECGLGFQVKIEAINSHAGLVAAYITKYITKQLGKLLPGMRRIQTTQGFRQPTEMDKSAYSWQVWETFTSTDLQALYRLGLTPFDVQLKKEITFDDFEDGTYNPGE